MEHRSTHIIVNFSYGSLFGHLLGIVFFTVKHDRHHTLMFTVGAVCWTIVLLIWLPLERKVNDE
jgi:hypothetical protein